MRYKFNLAKQVRFSANEEFVMIKTVPARSLEEALESDGEFETIPIPRGQTYEKVLEDFIKNKKKSIFSNPTPTLGFGGESESFGSEKFYDMDSCRFI